MKDCRVKWNGKKTVYVVCQAEWTAVFTDDDVSISKITKKLSSVSYRINLFHIGLIKFPRKIHNVVCFTFYRGQFLSVYNYICKIQNYPNGLIFNKIVGSTNNSTLYLALCYLCFFKINIVVKSRCILNKFISTGVSKYFLCIYFSVAYVFV